MEKVLLFEKRKRGTAELIEFKSKIFRKSIADL